jgi:hypothetical protein
VLANKCHIDPEGASNLKVTMVEPHGQISLTTKIKFQVAELEIFALKIVDDDVTCEIRSSKRARLTQESTTKPIVSVSQTAAPAVDDSNRPTSTGNATSDLIHTIHQEHANLALMCTELDTQIDTLLGELRLIAQFIGVHTPQLAGSDDISDADSLCEVEQLIELLTAQVSTNQNDQIVYIKAGGFKVAVNKTTLQQAPSGSMLTNMASDVWGHDLDSDGCIIQDVNSNLFVTVINYLRIKALPSVPTDSRPPIVIHKQDKSAMENMLAFYAMSDVLVKCI